MFISVLESSSGDLNQCIASTCLEQEDNFFVTLSEFSCGVANSVKMSN